MRVGIIGIGMTAFRPSTPEYNWKELMFEAASRAYADAAINPREDVDSFITCAEDYYEGFGIFDEFVPDQLGAALRPTCTVSGDGLQNPRAAYGAAVDAAQAMQSEERFAPLRALDISNPADGCVVLVLASDRAAKKLHSNPVWIRGIGWASDSPSLETRDWTGATYARIAADMAYRLAKVRRPLTDIDFAEVDDRFSYKELQHLESLGFAKKGEAGTKVLRGDYDADGRFPGNVSGGSLGCGNVFEATGLHRAAEVALQLRGDAGVRQVDGVRLGVAQSWRFIPSATGAVAVLGAGP